MTQIVIGTAGHIDHGKTALVKALTGTDTDGLAEEKARGMTIDLGFAFLNESVTIIDVPGHEKFIRNMVAGVSTIHIALLVVAADDGVMPQTREHLHILKLLQIPHCVVAITKIDLIDDEEWIDLVEMEINELTKNIFQNVQIVKTSTQTGIGIDELKHVLMTQTGLIQQSAEMGYFRLQADRVFSITGFGTVVTGTVIDGELKKGETVEIIPGEEQAKVRGIQSHGKNVELVRQGDRAAVNLSGVDVHSIFRGSELTMPGRLKSVTKFTARLVLIEEMKKELKHGQRVRIHMGTSEVLCRVYFTSMKNMSGGSVGNVILHLEKPISVATNDRFVLRSYSPMTTMGGGIVLTTFIPKNVTTKDWVASLDISLDKRFYQLVGSFKQNPKTMYDWGKSLQMPDKRIRQLVKKSGLNISKHTLVYSDENLKECEETILSVLIIFHENNPLREYMGTDVLRQETGLSEKWLINVLELMEKDGAIQNMGNGVALADHKIELKGRTAELSDNIANVLLKSGFTPIKTAELSDKFNIILKDVLEILHALKNAKKVVEIENGVWVYGENMSKLHGYLLEHFNQQNDMNVTEFKNITGLTRKFAIPMLEYTDKVCWTERDGNVRLKGEKL